MTRWTASKVPPEVARAAAAAVAAAPRAAILVERRSDQAAVRALAARRGRNLDADALAIVALGGVTNLGHYVDVLGPRGADQPLWLVHAAEAVTFRFAHLPGAIAFADADQAVAFLRADDAIVVYGSDPTCDTSRTLAIELSRRGFADVSWSPTDSRTGYRRPHRGHPRTHVAPHPIADVLGSHESHDCAWCRCPRPRRWQTSNGPTPPWVRPRPRQRRVDGRNRSPTAPAS